MIIRWLSHPKFAEPPEISPLEDDHIVPNMMAPAWLEESVEGRCYAEWCNKVVQEQVVNGSPIKRVKRSMTVVDQSPVERTKRMEWERVPANVSP
jgi:hypothetical protein